MLDIFSGDAFSTLSLTLAIEKLPFKPGRLGEMGLFKPKGVPDLVVSIEEKYGSLSLIPTAARGSMPTYDVKNRRKLRSFSIPYIPMNDAVMASEVQGVRAFGSEDENEVVATVVNDKLTSLKQNHEVTEEYHRIGALQGIVHDADGTSVIYNWFTEFGLSEQTVAFDFTTEDDDMNQKALDVIRLMEDTLGATTYSGIGAMCGNDFFDAFIKHSTVAGAYERYQENSYQRDGYNKLRKGFTFGEIEWWNYRGSIGSVDFVPTDVCRFYPIGVPNLFMTFYGPAGFMETVNTIGKPLYVKQEPMRFDVGIELHTQKNPLVMCTRPRVLIKGVGTFPT